MTINCIAVDDEPLALSLVSSFIDKTPFLNGVGTFSSAIEALGEIEKRQVQLIFLDIEMPDLNGMEFSRLLMNSTRNSTCKIIFTTAYNQFAIEGYQVDALYYLLKPFNYAEFLMAANKAKNYFEQQQALAPSPAMEEQQTLEERYLFLKVDYKLVRVDFDQILYVESYKDYVKVHTVKEDAPLTSLASLKSVVEKLPKNEFTRIHRSFVVANSKIDAISRNGVEIGRQHIPVGDQYKEDFKQLLQRWG
ncbi:LytR/AlgR family response regulator transcription factor [Olivibacter sitiensis]|uniref:LytR/AlgR family response regulator transcription factor n=1 Tax=Olivibacter sitiensis TaxID=376470 RepID=UPI0003F8762C|nr:LytTR family DNA-binding domain-containing protein [Olivibacter sitiensis]